MYDCATTTTRFDTQAGLELEVAFDGGRLTSDGGLALVAQADTQLGLCEALASCAREWRRGPVKHSLVELFRQRVFQIACGYEDQDDLDGCLPLSDPMFKLMCGRLPESGADLAGRPTMSRMENASTAASCYRMAQALGDVYIRERGKDCTPQKILLDLDGTDDPTHGDQEGTAYHGYYGQHMYHPLLVFDGETGHLVTAILRPGSVHASRGVVAILKRIAARVRKAWPGVEIAIRADAGFAVPALYEYCEQQHFVFTIGMVTNRRLVELGADLVAEARRQYDATQHKARLIGEFEYRARELGERKAGGVQGRGNG